MKIESIQRTLDQIRTSRNNFEPIQHILNRFKLIDLEKLSNQNFPRHI